MTSILWYSLLMRCELGKSHRGSKEYTREQKLVNENKQLKRELSRIKKQLARIDLDRYSTIKDMVEEHRMDNKLECTEDLLESLKQQWKCHDCSEGYLEIIIYTKIGNPWYFRKCNFCVKRTRSKQYDSSQVKGIVKNG